MSKKQSSIGVYDVCYPGTSNTIATFRLCNKHAKDYIKKWNDNDYVVLKRDADKGMSCDACPEEETT
jgi:hypothetical protein